MGFAVYLAIKHLGMLHTGTKEPSMDTRLNAFISIDDEHRRSHVYLRSDYDWWIAARLKQYACVVMKAASSLLISLLGTARLTSEGEM